MNCMKLKNVLPLLVVLALGCRREKADVLFPEGEGSCEVAFQVNPKLVCFLIPALFRASVSLDANASLSHSSGVL